MKTAFAMMEGFTRATYGKITPELRRRCMELMLTHRLNPDDISRTEPPAVADLLYARQRGLNAFNVVNLVPKPKGNPLWVCCVEVGEYPPDFAQQLARRLDGYLQELRKHDLAKLAYFYGFDERGPEYDELIKGICKFLKQRYPEVSTLTTAGYMYDKRRQAPADYQNYMDWYCPLTPKYDRGLSQRLRARGKQVWWYVCCGPQYPYANFAAMDYPSIEGRLLAWMTFGFQSDGLLYWHVNYWRPNRIMADADPYLDYKVESLAGMPGDGLLIYPTRDGPVSSIRLENIRDGLEDYDYLALLADAKGRAAAEAYVMRLVKGLTDFSRDPAGARARAGGNRRTTGIAALKSCGVQLLPSPASGRGSGVRAVRAVARAQQPSPFAPYLKFSASISWIRRKPSACTRRRFFVETGSDLGVSQASTMSRAT